MSDLDATTDPTTPGTIVVSGATGAIGAAVCRLLAVRGHHVTALYRSADDAASALVDELHQLGTDATSIRIDLTDAGATQSVISHVLERQGRVEALIHAAGPHVPQRFLSGVAPEEFAEQLVGEAAAFFNLVQPAIPALRDTQGAIVAVTTVATRRFPLRDGLSPGTKASVEAVVRVLAAEEGRFGIRANCVGPGILSDGMAARFRESGEFSDDAAEHIRRAIPLRRLGTARDVAEVVCFLASSQASYVTGQIIDVDGGYSI